MRIWTSYSSAETKKIARMLAKKLRPSKKAKIFALKGELGSGKTTFVQGFVRALGVRGRVMSPTFILMRRFKLKRSSFKNAYHLDAYRIKTAKDARALVLGELWNNPRNIILIEWPENLKKIPAGAVRLYFRHGSHEKERKITIK